MWEQPSLMVGGVMYRKVTERVILSDGTLYESAVEEMEKNVDEEGRRHPDPRSISHINTRSKSEAGKKRGKHAYALLFKS